MIMVSKEVIYKLPEFNKYTELISELQLVLCIYYLVQFKEKSVQAFIDLSNKVNVMSPIFAKKPSLWVSRTEFGIQKIYDPTFKIFEIIIVSFSIDNKVGNLRFFEKTFLITDINIDMVLEMLFLTISNTNFLEQKLY